MTTITDADKKATLRPFLVIWAGQALSLIGTQVVQFGIIWWLTLQTGSGTVLATASMAGLLPQLLVAPFAGPLVDRWNRRLTMLISDGVVALITLGLAVLFLTDSVQIWHVYIVLFLRSAIGSFHGPAMMASMSLMVPDSALTRIQGLNQMLNGGLNIIAAPIGAALLAVMSIGQLMFVDVVTAVFAIVPLLFVFVPQPAAKPQQVGVSVVSSYLADLKDGFSYIWGWRGLLVLMVLVAVLNMVIAPAMSLIPLHVTNYFDGQEWQYAFIQMAFSVGVLAGGLTLGAWGGFKRNIHTSLLGLAGIGAGVLLLGLTPASLFPLAVTGMAVAGMMVAFTNGPMMAIMQKVVAPDMQGRVFNLLGAVSTAAVPLGLVIAGPLADVVGTQAFYIAAGVVCLLVPTVSVFNRAIMTLEDYKATAEVETTGMTPDPEGAGV